MKFFRLCLLLPALLPALALAQPTGALEASKAKVESALAELKNVRDIISEEKIPLSSQMRELEKEVIGLRREAERVQRLNDNQSVDLANLESQVKAYQDEFDYATNLLNEYANRLNASIDASEISIYGDKLLETLNALEVAELSKDEKLSSQVSALSVGLDRLETVIGGARFSGQAVAPDGRLVDGNFALIGPMVYFASNDGTAAGLAQRGSTSQPAVIVFDENAKPAIKSFVETGSGEVMMDATLGRALALATTKETLVEHFLAGGLWMWPIAFFGVLAIALALFKTLDIFSIKPLPEGALATIFGMLQEGKTSEAEHFAKSLPGPMGKMLQQGLHYAHLPKELVEEILFEAMLEVKPKLERGISYIMLSASVAPLLGLLGTVTGMIETFKLLTLFGTGDAKSLSSGISQALITTEYGLVVAIPSLLLAALLNRKVTAMMGDMEKLSISFVNGLAAIKSTKQLTAAE